MYATHMFVQGRVGKKPAGAVDTVETGGTKKRIKAVSYMYVRKSCAKLNISVMFLSSDITSTIRGVQRLEADMVGLLSEIH